MMGKEGKPRFSLIPQGTLDSIIQVLEFGAQKHGVGSYKLVGNPTLFLDAVQRHLAKHRHGVTLDEETGLPHLAHAAANLILWLDNEQANKACLAQAKPQPIPPWRQPEVPERFFEDEVFGPELRKRTER